MIRTFTDCRTALATLGLLLLIGATPLTGQSGRTLFEEAYRLEGAEPDRALELYEAALQRGLPADLDRAARWRRFHLLRQLRLYPEAWLASAVLGGQARGTLKQDMLRYYKVSEGAIESYLSGTAALSSTTAQSRAALELRRAFELGSGRPVFQSEILTRMVRAGLEQQAREILTLAGGGLHPLLRADFLLAVNDVDQSAILLHDFVRQTSSPSAEEGARALYLLGRVARARGQHADAVRFFRLAAARSSGDMSLRVNALAAYSLYQMGLPEQAFDLLQGWPLQRDEEAELLALTIRTELNLDARAQTQLRARRSNLRRDLQHDPQNWLKRKALSLVEAGEVGR
ncbi:MAG: hypothetical protein K1X75_14865 [Leptospirales bacterium]|nr:hypothetical protein [Leptospirales bacterium]